MKLYFNLFELFVFICIVKATDIEYTVDGVLRKENNCNINFVNFGIEDTIRHLTVNLSKSTLTIEKLYSGNDGLNSGDTYKFDHSEIKDYVKVTQNGKEIKSFEVEYDEKKHKETGEFNLKINGINSCDGLTIKQTYKANLLVNSYLLYVNKIPKPINTSFPEDQFGPSSNGVPYDKLFWDMNGGLDEIRKECGIYIDYKRRDNDKFVWYLSIENRNIKECTNSQFYKIAREYFQNYDVMKELFGDYYEGYVIKRESSNAAHMDGIVNSEYIIEVYQEACGTQNENQVVCTISSDDVLTFNQFTEKLRNNCLSLIIDNNEEGTWTASSTKVVGKFENYSITIENNGKGSLPQSSDGKVGYSTFKAANSSGVARFKTSFACKDGTYSDEKCRCHACSDGCAKCKNAETCLTCIDKENANLINGECKCGAKEYMNNEGKCKQCGEDCETCEDAETCTTCKDTLKHIVDGKCECNERHYMDSKGNCVACPEGCNKCDKNGCIECDGEGKIPKDGVCICDKSFYEDLEHNCHKCDPSCATCNKQGKCTTCLDSNAVFSDGVCVCQKSYLTENGKCYVCDASCKACDENGCTACADSTKEPVNGVCS